MNVVVTVLISHCLGLWLLTSVTNQIGYIYHLSIYFSSLPSLSSSRMLDDDDEGCSSPASSSSASLHHRNRFRGLRDDSGIISPSSSVAAKSSAGRGGGIAVPPSVTHSLTHSLCLASCMFSSCTPIPKDGRLNNCKIGSCPLETNQKCTVYSIAACA